MLDTHSQKHLEFHRGQAVPKKGSLASNMHKTGTGQHGNEEWAGVNDGDDGDVIGCHYPMYLLPMTTVLEMHSIGMHERLLDESLLVQRSVGNKPLFVSQTWLSPTNPDRDNVKWNMLKDVLRAMFAGKFAVHSHWLYELTHGPFTISAEQNLKFTENGFVWFDYCSIPQENVSQMILAVRSIPAYIAQSDMFIVLVPVAVHERGFYVDFHTWAGRGWCRAERLLNVLSPVCKPEIVVQTSRTAHITHPKEWWLWPVGRGQFSVDADRKALGKVLNGAITAREKIALADNDLMYFRMLHVSRHRMLDGTDFLSELTPPMHQRKADRSSLRNTSYDDWMEILRFKSALDEQHSGWTPLRFAIYDGRLDIAQRLIEESADVNAPLAESDAKWDVHKGTTILCGAAYWRDCPEAIQFLLERKADATIRDAMNMSALCAAAEGNNTNNFSTIANQFPELYLDNKFGNSCLTLAVNEGCFEMVQHITKNWRVLMNSSVDRRGQRETDPGYRGPMDAGLIFCASGDHPDTRLLELLIEMGFDVNCQSEHAHKSWFVWSVGRALEAVYAVQRERASMLIELCSHSTGLSALSLASFHGNVAAVRTLLAHKADAATKNVYQRSALHFAADKGHEVIVGLLLAAGAPLGDVDSEGLTASALAHRRGHPNVEHVLQTAGDHPAIAIRACAWGGGCSGCSSCSRSAPRVPAESVMVDAEP